MRAFLAVTCTLCTLVVIAHVLRIFAEGIHVARDPVFLAATIAAAGISAWALVLLLRSRRQPKR